MKFIHTEDSHMHSLDTLNLLYNYDDFMFSIKTVIDLGCGNGSDLMWWATRTTRDPEPLPLNIKCTGVDLNKELLLLKKYSNISYQMTDFDESITPSKDGYDILWCHDSFQYSKNPLRTLTNWWHLASPGAMLYICVPDTQQIHHRQLN